MSIYSPRSDKHLIQPEQPLRGDRIPDNHGGESFQDRIDRIMGSRAGAFRKEHGIKHKESK